MFLGSVWYATECFRDSVRDACKPFVIIAIDIARSRHKTYPVSSPIGFYGPARITYGASLAW